MSLVSCYGTCCLAFLPTLFHRKPALNTNANVGGVGVMKTFLRGIIRETVFFHPLYGSPELGRAIRLLRRGFHQHEVCTVCTGNLRKGCLFREMKVFSKLTTSSRGSTVASTYNTQLCVTLPPPITFSSLGPGMMGRSCDS